MRNSENISHIALGTVRQQLHKSFIYTKIIKDNKVLKPFELSNRLLPTKHDCLLYVLSQTNQYAEKMSPKSVVRRLPKLAEEIWNKVDCSPSSNKTITKLFESGIWDNYKSLIREHYLPRESLPSTRKRSHIKDPSKQKQ